jgi:hypothetical protein
MDHAYKKDTLLSICRLELEHGHPSTVRLVISKFKSINRNEDELLVVLVAKN